MEPIVFKQWSNKKYAVLQSLKKVIKIGSLCICYSLLQGQAVFGQTDTVSLHRIYELEEIEIPGSIDPELYSDALRQVLLIANEQLSQSSSHDYARILNYQPGVDIRSRGPNNIQSDLSIRGGSFEQSLVLINGINFSNPQTGHFNLDVPMSHIGLQNIEILKGAATRLYGKNAYSGAINFVTEPNDSLSMAAQAQVGQFSSYSGAIDLHLPYKNWKNQLTVQHSQSEGYKANTDFDLSSAFWHSRLSNSHLQSDFYLGGQQKSFGANAFYTPKYPEQYEETSAVLSALSIQTLSIKPKLQLNLYWKKASDHFMLFRTNPAAYENYHLSTIAGSDVSLQHSSAYGISNLSASLRNEQIFSSSLGEETEKQIGIPGADSLFYENSAHRNYGSVNFDHDYQNGRWYLSFGALLHTNLKVLSPEIYPGIDLSYKINPSNRLMISISRSLRVPSFTDLYYIGPQNLGNPQLKPEKANNIESSWQYSTNHMAIHQTLYLRQGKQTIDWVWIDDIWQSRNIGELNSFGYESSIAYSPEPTSLLSPKQLSISYDYNQISRASNEFTSNYALDNLKHKLLLQSQWEWESLSLDAQLLYHNRNGFYQYYETPDATPNEQPYDPYWLFNLSVSYKLQLFEIYLDGANLFNSSYRDIGSVTMPGRIISIGLKFMP